MSRTFTPGVAATGSRASTYRHNIASAHSSGGTHRFRADTSQAVLAAGHYSPCTGRPGDYIPGSPSDCWPVLDNIVEKSDGSILDQRATDPGIVHSPNSGDARGGVVARCRARAAPYPVLGRNRWKPTWDAPGPGAMGGVNVRQIPGGPTRQDWEIYRASDPLRQTHIRREGLSLCNGRTDSWEVARWLCTVRQRMRT